MTIIVADMNFPNIILVILNGDVSNSCSVPVFLSSAIDLIVNNGIINANTSIVGSDKYMYSKFTFPYPITVK